MKTNTDKLLMWLLAIFLLEFIFGAIFIILITNGIRIDRKIDNGGKKDYELVEYEQVYHVFTKQEVFLTIENKTDKVIGTLVVKEKNSGKTDYINKVLPGKKTKLYFDLDSYYDDVEFEVEKVTYVEMY